jgi:hypothetical protein
MSISLKTHALNHPIKADPPGGTSGRVGCDTGVDEAPVPDTASTISVLVESHPGADPGRLPISLRKTRQAEKRSADRQ